MKIRLYQTGAKPHVEIIEKTAVFFIVVIEDKKVILREEGAPDWRTLTFEEVL